MRSSNKWKLMLSTGLVDNLMRSIHLFYFETCWHKLKSSRKIWHIFYIFWMKMFVEIWNNRNNALSNSNLFESQIFLFSSVLIECLRMFIFELIICEFKLQLINIIVHANVDQIFRNGSVQYINDIIIL